MANLIVLLSAKQKPSAEPAIEVPAFGFCTTPLTLTISCPTDVTFAALLPSLKSNSVLV